MYRLTRHERDSFADVLNQYDRLRPGPDRLTGGYATWRTLTALERHTLPYVEKGASRRVLPPESPIPTPELAPVLSPQ